MMKKFLALATLAFVVTGCAAEKSASPTDSGAKAPAAPVTTTAGAVASLPERARAPFSTLMTSYDSIHDALAKDSVAGVATAAIAIKTAAVGIEPTAPEASKALWRGLAEAAGALSTSTADVRKSRESFSELNRALITVLAANPDLAKGRVVIECPMWKGYAKWVQTDDKVRNPFYGSSMLECGVKTDLKL